jgi:serine/threonine-protein kinase SRPK3
MDLSVTNLLSLTDIPFQRDAFADIEFEDVLQYTHKGFHPVRPGDVYHDGRYRIIRKLGFGSYSTVWLAEETK